MRLGFVCAAPMRLERLVSEPLNPAVAAAVPRRPSLFWWLTALIIISTQSSEKDRARGLSLGADDYLAKPLDPEALVSTVQRLLSNRPAAG